MCDFIQNCIPDCEKKRRLRLPKSTCWQSRMFNLHCTSSFWQSEMPFHGNLELFLFNQNGCSRLPLIQCEEHNSAKGHNSNMRKSTGQLFLQEESVYEISKPWHSPFKSCKFHLKVELSIKISKFCNFVKI